MPNANTISPIVTYLLSLLCVIGIAVGQVLFKVSANTINAEGTIFSIKPIIYLAITFGLYGLTSIGWVFILRYAELGKIYPMMALAFVIVPLASHFLFGEQFPKGFYLGTALLISGLLVIFTTST